MPRPSYLKRYRLQWQGAEAPPVPPLPPGFLWLPWTERLVAVHAAVKFRAFYREPDTALFPSLGSEPGCRVLMKAIVELPEFCAKSTWLIAGPSGAVGTVQGLLDDGTGTIQNLGVHPEYRGLGLGKALLRKAMHGFLAAGASTIALEVTAGNRTAMALYRNSGFRPYKTVYLPHRAPEPLGAGI